MPLRLPPSGFVDRTAPIGGMGYAGWLRRAGGALVDALVVNTIRFLISALFGVVIAGFLSHLPGGWTGWTITLALSESVEIVYATACLARLNGQTVGMRILRAKCVRISGREGISVPQALTRSVAASLVGIVPFIVFTVVLHVPTAAFLVVLAAYLWPLIDARRQTWWDKAAQTVVVYEGLTW